MCGRKNHKEKTNEEERRITKKRLLPERMWIQDWTIVQCDGSFHTVTKASDNKSKSEVTVVIGVVVNTTEQIHSLKPELRLYAG